MTITYNRAIEIIQNAHKYNMKDIRKAEHILNQACDKAEAWDALEATNTKQAKEMMKLGEDHQEWGRNLWKNGAQLQNSIEEMKQVIKEGESQ